MNNVSSTDYPSRFAAQVIAHRSGPFLMGSTLDALMLGASGSIMFPWAPFDYVSQTARLVIVGITPGRQQAENALSAFRGSLAANATPAEASRHAKFVGAFSGPMRSNLIAMLNHVGAQRVLGVPDYEALFDPSRELVHLTSALRYPVFVDGQNYNGTPDMLKTPILRSMVETHLAAEARALSSALWLPLGPKPLAALNHLVASGILKKDRILSGMPHPSGANAERIAYFLGRKTKETLSPKTVPVPLDLARDALRAQIARLTTI